MNTFLHSIILLQLFKFVLNEKKYLICTDTFYMLIFLNSFRNNHNITIHLYIKSLLGVVFSKHFQQLLTLRDSNPIDFCPLYRIIPPPSHRHSLWTTAIHYHYCNICLIHLSSHPIKCPTHFYFSLEIHYTASTNFARCVINAIILQSFSDW